VFLKQNTGRHKNQAKNSTWTLTHARLSRSREQQGKPTGAGKENQKTLERSKRKQTGRDAPACIRENQITHTGAKTEETSGKWIQSDLSGEEDKSFGRHKNHYGWNCFFLTDRLMLSTKANRDETAPKIKLRCGKTKCGNRAETEADSAQMKWRDSMKTWSPSKRLKQKSIPDRKYEHELVTAERRRDWDRSQTSVVRTKNTSVWREKPRPVSTNQKPDRTAQPKSK
jgi:hypothetical protein